jgi:hypothetical protein
MHAAGPKQGPTSLTELARLTGEFQDWHNIVHCVAWLHGQFEIEALRQAWQQVCLRHDSLRRHYASPDEAWTYPDVPGELIIRDAETDLEAVSLVRSIIGAPFKLDEGPLARIVVVRCGPNTHLLGLAMDHIITDQRSWSRVTTELGLFYERARQHEKAFCRGTAANSYQEFASLQRRELSGNWGTKRRNFWIQHTQDFGSYPPGLGVTAVHQGAPSLQALHYPLPTDVPRTVVDLASSVRATPFVIVAAAVLSSMQEVTGTSRAGINVDHHGRILPGTSDTVGEFVHTAPLHLAACHSELAGAVEEVLHRSFDVFEYNLPLLAAGRFWNEELQDPARLPGVHVNLNQNNPALPPGLFADIRAEHIDINLPGGRQWPETIVFAWHLSGKEPTAKVYYNDHFFQRHIVTALAEEAVKRILSIDR